MELQVHVPSARDEDQVRIRRERAEQERRAAAGAERAVAIESCEQTPEQAV